MKLVGYTPQVQPGNIGNVRVEAPQAQAIANMGKMQAQGLGGLAKGVDVALGFVQRHNEELDAVNAQAASNEYTKRLNELMYNQDNGLMNTKFQQAEGITMTFEEKERQIRQEVGSQYKFNTRKGQLVFQNMANNSAAQRFEMVRKHQTQQFNAYRDVTYANGIELNMQTAGNNYMSPDIVEDNVKQAIMSASMHYAGQGEEVVQRQGRKAAGDVALYSINRALTAGDLNAAEGMLDKYAGFIDASKLPGLVENIRAQRENNFMVDSAMMLARSGLKGPELEKAINNLQTPGSTGNLKGLLSMSAATLGQPYKLGTDGSNGTWDCGLWTQTMLNNNGENIRTRTADGQYAQMESEGRAFNDSSKLKPGDLVFWHTTDQWKYTDNPNAGADEAYKGITHVGIYVGDGKVRQAGNSGVSDINLDDYKVIGFGRTNMGAQEQGRSLDSTQKWKLASMIETQRAKDKRIEADRQDSLIKQAQNMFRADPYNADPDAIAKEVAGDDVPMGNTIKELLTDAKYKIEQKGIPDAQMNVVFDMIKAGQFDSLTRAIQYVQVPGRKANTKQIDQIEKWWDDKLKLKGLFAYEHLDQFLNNAVAGIKDQDERFTRKNRLRTYAENWINEYRRDPKHNGQDPSYQELQAALSKDITETKMIATTSDGRRITYTPLMNSDNNIISVNPIGDGRVSVTYRDARNNPYAPTRTVNMFVEQYAELIGSEVQSSWLGNSEDMEQDTAALGLK